MTLAEPVRITQQIAQIFERLQIKYFVGGSLASSLHGIPRATQDVDIVVDLSLKQAPQFVKALEKEFYIDEEMIREAIQRYASFNVIHLATMFKVDIFILKPNATSQEEMARRDRYSISGEPTEAVFLASAEDIILHKLYWFQLGGSVSERQWNDVLGVIQVQAEQLDYGYLERAAEERGIGHLLKQVFEEFKSGKAVE